VAVLDVENKVGIGVSGCNIAIRTISRETVTYQASSISMLGSPR
jgi:hypothetical protein